MNKPNLDLSLVIPVYNEDESLPELFDWIVRVIDANGINAEVLFVDDGSTDASWEVITSLNQKDRRAKGTRFNRNYGKSAALNVGFNQSKGEVIITMDADLQDSPDEIPGLVSMIREEGFHLVSGWKRKRHDPFSKTFPSKFFNKVTSWVSGIKLHDFNCGLKAYHHSVIKNIDVYGEMHRYIPLIAKWNGFTKIGERVVEHRARKYGVTKFGWERFVNGFLDLISVTFVSRFRKNPMHFFGLLGTLSFGFGAIVTVYLIADKMYCLHYGLSVRDIVDQPLFFLALVALIIGTQLFLAGFLAEMVTLVNPKKNDYLIVEKLGDNA